MGKSASIRRDWRQFELAVSKLESLLRPRGYSFKSPDHLIDKDTGAEREVDCSITDLATGEIVSVECRRRSKRQDVLWIEQLTAKKTSLGLSGTIAVSSRGFSRTAKLRAQKHGVVVKTYREIAQPSFLIDDKHGLQLRHLAQRGTIHGSTITFGTEDDEPVLNAQYLSQIVAAIDARGDRAVILREVASGRELTMRDLVQGCVERYPTPGVSAASVHCRLTFAPKTVALVPLEILVHVTAVSFVLDVDVSDQPMRLPTLFRYEGDEGGSLNVASAEFETIEGITTRLEVTFAMLDAHGRRTV